MILRSFLASLILCLLCSILLARPGTVRTKDGRSIEGDIADRETMLGLAERHGDIDRIVRLASSSTTRWPMTLVCT